jgi:hypothetical protein
VILTLRKIASVNRASRNESRRAFSSDCYGPQYLCENVPHTASCNVQGAEDQVPWRPRRGSQDAEGFWPIATVPCFRFSSELEVYPAPCLADFIPSVIGSPGRTLQQTSVFKHLAISRFRHPIFAASEWPDLCSLLLPSQSSHKTRDLGVGFLKPIGFLCPGTQPTNPGRWIQSAQIGLTLILQSLRIYGSVLAGHQVRLMYHERRDRSGSRLRRLARLTPRDFLNPHYCG